MIIKCQTSPQEKKGSQLVLHHLFWVRSSFIPVLGPQEYRKRSAWGKLLLWPTGINPSRTMSISRDSRRSSKKVFPKGCGCYVIHRSLTRRWRDPARSGFKGWIWWRGKNKNKNLRVHSRTVLVWTHEADPNREEKIIFSSLSKKLSLALGINILES